MMRRPIARLAFPLAAMLAAAALGFVGSLLVAHATGGGPVPPIFLAEQDARPVIEAELQAAGLTLAADAETIPGALQKRELVWRYVKDDDDERYVAEETRDPPTDLVLDGYDAERQIGYEYLDDEEDYEAAGGIDRYFHEEVVAREMAAHLRLRLLSRAGGRRIAVFWAPLADPEWDKCDDYGQALAAGMKRAQETLRGRVREFVAKLKAEGALE